MDLGGNTAAALAHAVDFGHLDIITGLHEAVYQNLGRQDGTLAADTDKNCAFAVHLPSSFLLMAPTGQTCAQTVQPTH